MFLDEYFLNPQNTEFWQEADEHWESYKTAYSKEYEARRRASVAREVVDLMNSHKTDLERARRPQRSDETWNFCYSMIRQHEPDIVFYERRADELSEHSDSAFEDGRRHFLDNQERYYDYGLAIGREQAFLNTYSDSSKEQALDTGLDDLLAGLDTGRQ